MKTRFALIVVLMLLLPLLAACGGDATPTTQAAAARRRSDDTPPAPGRGRAHQHHGAAAQPTTAPSGDKVTVTLATWTGADEAKELQAVIDKINAAATDFEIVHQASPADYYTKLQTSIAGNTAADLMWLVAGVHRQLRRQRRDPRHHRPGRQAERHARRQARRLLPRFAGTCRKYNGKLYGLPWIAQPVMLYYNPTPVQDGRASTRPTKAGPGILSKTPPRS